MRFIALLRGINVGGNNKVAMTELKACLEAEGFTDVTTYINSGNVLFDSQETDTVNLVTICEAAIEKRFGFHVVCSIISADDLLNALDHAPKWWNKGDAKHNAIFVIAPKTAEEIMTEVGEAKHEYEQVAAYHPIIFWTAPLKTFSRTRYSKIVGTRAYQFVTIRNANTTLKLAELCQQA
ncbi:MAG: DUF1697 domain-containing protein [Candidatus Saccharibacteria bacterium]|nr:DUF1697 domain-containing protein [Candidatus Saccharibacteria bacterium]